MELFALHCTTCKARLKVTDESVIGQILSCPKCESMVMIEPPPGWKSAGAVAAVVAPAAPLGGSGSLGASGSSFSIKAPTAPAKTMPAPASEVNPPAAKAPSTLAPPPLPVAAVKPAPAAPAANSPPPTPTIATSMASAPSVGTAASSDGIKSKLIELTRSHDVRVLAGGIAGGIMVGTLLFVLLMPGGSEDAPPEVAKVDVPKVSVEFQKVEAEPRPEVLPVVAQEDSVAESDVTEVRTLKPVVEGLNEEVVEDTEELESAKPQADVPGAPIEEAADVAAEEDNAAALPDTEPIAGDDAEPTAADENEPVEESAVLLPPTTGPRPSALLAKLDRRVYKLAFDKMPLRQFAAFVSEYGDVPITIDAASLQAAKIQTPSISIKQADFTTLNELLKKTLADLRLSFEARDGAIVIFAPPPTT